MCVLPSSAIRMLLKIIIKVLFKDLLNCNFDIHVVSIFLSPFSSSSSPPPLKSYGAECWLDSGKESWAAGAADSNNNHYVMNDVIT